ncbi:MAG: hypothetical protein KJZ87_08355 [Thermoguttaceae bacterium]|nr:hypothetical protein [Thermoguttaceae bacterium]
MLAGQRLPAKCVNPETLWHERFQDFVNLVDYQHRNGTRIIKFFPHPSEEKQRHRFLGRIDEPDKNWKLSPADIEMRERGDDFQHACAGCFGATSKQHAPWYVVPADDKRNSRLIISHAIVRTMKTLKMSYPGPTEVHWEKLHQVRRLLAMKVQS